ncbi:hypothetical protein PG997_005379 [Apiospora hydei]|uniref:Uncharacterized protein n=1 Tax=Apiospora hydei TaxID=1337664 RepID=A0ABR1X4V2_9PEZI
MDALSALSVAGTIITFVDFGGKLLSNTRKLYKSKDGALGSFVDIEVVTSDLIALLEGLKKRTPESHLPSGRQYHVLGSDEDDEALDKICVRCIALAEELAARLNRLKLATAPQDGKTQTGTGSPPKSASNPSKSPALLAHMVLGAEGSKKNERARAPAFRKWESFRKALEAVWSKREIEEMAAALRDLRDEMEFRILVSFRRSLHTVAGQQSDAAIQLEQSTRTIIDTFLNSRDSFADQIKVQTEKLVQIQDLLTTKHVDNTRRVEDVTGGQLDAIGSFESTLGGAGRPRRASEDRSERALAVEENLLPWHNLVAWLRHGDGIYWINGKLGSGKSTLMKYVYEHSKTRDELKSWAKGHPLEISGFFFWDRGDEDQSHIYMKQLAKRHPDETSQLVSDVVHKARGVFLWVKLVTRSLLGGLSDCNRISDLRKRVSHLPSHLEALYRHILDGVDPFYRTQMSQTFQIVCAAQNGSPGLVTLLNLSWADDEDGPRVEDAPIQPYTNDEIEERCEIMDARLKSVCAGLLETTRIKFSSLRPDRRVVYLHHTVSDWLAKPDVWKHITSITAGTGFSPNLALLKSRIMRLKTWNSAGDGILDLSLVVDALHYAREAERDLHTRDFTSYLQLRPLYLSTSSLSSSSGSSGIWYSFPEAGSEAGDNFRQGGQVYPEERGRRAFEESIDRPHWSRAIEVPGGRALDGRGTFFELARAFGLTHYVDMKYDAGHAAVEHEVSHWLLLQAFSGTCGSATANRPKDPNVEQVRRILASGVDPNLSFDGGLTPWQGAVFNAFWHLSRRPSPSDDDDPHALWREKAQAWAQILEAFLQHGSDPACPAVRRRQLPRFPRVTPTALVEAYSVNS